MREMTYQKDTLNDILSGLFVALTDDLLCIDEMNEALGDHFVIEGLGFGLGAFGLVAWGTHPLGGCRLGVEEEA